MSFLAPLWLLSGGLGAIVILLHALRHRRVEVPSVIVWRHLITGNRARSALRPPRWSWLLLLQVSAVLLLAAALAQPIIGAGRQPLHAIFVLDASGSMRGTDVRASRFEAAVATLAARLREQGDVDHTSLLLAGIDPAIAFARQADGAALVPEVEQLQAGDGAANWRRVAASLRAVIRPGEETSVTVLTDAADAAISAIANTQPGLTVTIQAFGEPRWTNAAISATLVAVPEEQNTWQLAGTVTMTGEGPPPQILVRFLPVGGDGLLDWMHIAPEPEPARQPDGAMAYAFQQALELPSEGLVVLTLPHDPFPHDNQIGLSARGSPVRLRALYLGPGNAPLELALLSRGDVELFRSTTGAPADAEAYDLVIADTVVLAERPATNLLWLGTGRLASDPEPKATQGGIVGWNGDHPLSPGMRWSAVTADGALAAPLMAGATAVLSTAQGAVIQGRTTATGREIRLGAPTDPDGWAGTALFPTFVSNIIDWLDAGEVIICTAGRACAVPARLIDAAVVDARGNIVRPPATGAAPLLENANVFLPTRAGLLRAVADSGRAIIFVNPDPDERPATTPTATMPAEPPLLRPLQLTPLLIALAGILLLAEGIIAGRGDERFLRREALARGVPGATARRWALAFRFAALVFIVAALTGVPLPAPEPAEDTVLVVEPDSDGWSALLADAADQACNPLSGRSIGLVVLTATPQTAVATCPDGGGGDLGLEADPGADLGAAVELAAALVKPGRSGRIVLAADGNEDLPLSGDLVRALVDRGIVIDALPLTSWPAGDSLVGSVDLPERITEGDRPPLEALVHAVSAGTATFRVSVDGNVAERRDVTIRPGANRIATTLPMLGAGEHVVEVAVDDADPVPANNAFAVAVDVESGPRVAVVTPQTEWGEYFADALQVHDIDAKVMLPRHAPFYLDRWLAYDAVVLMNVPAIDLDSLQQDQLEELVRLHGRGLLILGGENSFGPGGYFQTPLEAVSPLSARVPKDLPVAALGFVLDRSGSMQAQVDGATRLDIARQATLSAIELLNEESQVAVVVFDTQATRIVPMQDRKDLPAVEAALARLQPGGGTSIYPGLEQMVEEMAMAESAIRHIVVMSDGLTQPADFEALARRARDMGITISAVAIGSGADVGTLEDIARLGGGSFHVTQDFRALPSILSQEAMMLNEEVLERGVVSVAWVDNDLPFLTGLPDPMPAVEFYVLTSLKPQARLHLATQDDDGDLVPILASWQYGNGSVMALATHGAGPGSVRWLQLAEYPLLWAQALRRFLPTTPPPGMSLELTRDGDSLALTANVLDADAEPIADLTPVATISREGVVGSEMVTLTNLGGGQYSTAFEAATPGTYVADVRAGEAWQAKERFIVPYPSALAFHQAFAARIEALASATGGALLTQKARLVSDQVQWQAKRVWRPWVLLALVTLLTDLAVRYLPGLFPFLGYRMSPRRTQVPA